MTGQFLAWGDFAFGIATMAQTGLRRSSAWRWPSQDRIGARPALHHTGPGAEVIDIDGVILTGLAQGDPIGDLRTAAGDGKARVLIQGGKELGLYALTSLEERQSAWLPSGPARARKARLTFTRQAEDL